MYCQTVVLFKRSLIFCLHVSEIMFCQVEDGRILAVIRNLRWISIMVNEGLVSLTKVEKARLSEVNEFSCGLHYLVALADQAWLCCKIWDKLCWFFGTWGHSKDESGA